MNIQLVSIVNFKKLNGSMESIYKAPYKITSLKEQVNNPNIIVGDYSYYAGFYHGHDFDECAHYLVTDRSDVDKLYIGKFCSIGSGVIFMMGGNQGHQKDWVSTFPFYMFEDYAEFAQAPVSYQPAGDTFIGNDVWIGEEAIIMPGIVVGDGAIIGARAVVTRDVEPYAIVAGNPARIIRKRFNDRNIELLMEMQWWEWPSNTIKEQLHLICAGDPEALYQSWQYTLASRQVRDS